MTHKIVNLHSDWLGIGRLRTGAGEFTRIMAGAVAGFNKLTPTAISVASGVMTITFGVATTYTVNAPITIKGAADVAVSLLMVPFPWRLPSMTFQHLLQASGSSH